MLVFLIALALSWGGCRGIELVFGGVGDVRSMKTIMVFAVQFITAVVVSNGFLWVLYRKNEDYKYLVNVVKKKVLKK